MRTPVISLLVALLCVLAVPVSQLRTFAAVTCCCPDPSHCHCPDHQPRHGTHSQMRACSNGGDTSVVPEAPPLVVTTAPVLIVPARAAIAIVFVSSQPHRAPPATRRDLPS